MKPMRLSQSRPRRGTVLIITILLTFALAGMVLVLCRSMRVESIAAANMAAAVQADSIERGGEQYVIALLTEEGQDISTLTEDQFAGIQVGDGYFWILRPEYEDPALPLFGLVDEPAKLNINTATYDQLMRLPAMTDDVAGAIVDWRDEDSTASAGGAESDYYLSLQKPYYAKNAPFETVEELLMVRGVTRQLLYGTGDAAPLGTANTSHNTSSLSSDPQLARGIYDLLTIYSVEGSAGGATGGAGQKININSRGQRDQLRDLLRQSLNGSRAEQIMAIIGTGRNSMTFRDIFDFYFRCRLTRDEFAAIEPRISSSNATITRGRINVNTAPREVLFCLENLDTSDVDKLIAQRGSTGSTNSLAWIPDALGSRAVGLGGFITASSYQYSADILAASGNGRSYKRVRIVVDTRSGTPQIIYRRDLSDRGWPMDKQVLASLRAGQGPGQTAIGSSMKTGMQ